MQIETIIFSFLGSILAMLLAITLHEFTHAWVANYLGDPTPGRAGRVSLNPIAHIDLFGTIILPLMLILLGVPAIGWAKPVPINPNNFKNPRLGSALTAVAGPLSNFLQAVVAAFAFSLSGISVPFLSTFLLSYIAINLALMVFNLVPLPPLDGSKFFALFFPILEDRNVEIYGPVILIVFIFVFNGFSYLVPIINFLAEKVLALGMPIF